MAKRTVFHVMRTYGNHGGERQLAQMFAQPAPDIEEHFIFLYRDALCETLFAENTQLKFHRLWPFALPPRYQPWKELLCLLPLLPIMQLRLFALFIRHKPRACIVHGFQAALVAWPVAMVLGGRVGFAYFHRITKSRTGRNPLFRVIYAPYCKLVGVSKAVRDSLAGLAAASRLMAIENGVDTQRILRAPPEAQRGGLRLIAVGRLLPHKGQHLLIEAFETCAGEFPVLELWIVGDGEDFSNLEADIAKRNLGGRAKLLGRREDISQLLAQATVFCHASAWEGMSNAVLEAMAAGLPSVVADAPGVSECHENGVTGFVVARDALSLAENIATLLRDQSLRERMGDAAAARARGEYSIQANRRKFLALYDELAGGSPCAA